jgi:hypothetical protein
MESGFMIFLLMAVFISEEAELLQGPSLNACCLDRYIHGFPAILYCTQKDHVCFLSIRPPVLYPSHDVMEKNFALRGFFVLF